MRRAIAKQTHARAAPQTIGANQGVSLHFLCLAGAHQHGAVRFGVVLNGQVQVELHGIPRLHCLEQQPVQVGAVNGGIGSAVTLYSIGTQGQHRQFVPRESTAHLQAIRKSSHILQRLLQTPSLETPHHVRAQLHTCTHFAESSSALVQPHLPASPRRSQRRCQSANAAACNQQLFFHGAIVPAALYFAVTPGPSWRSLKVQLQNSLSET